MWQSEVVQYPWKIGKLPLCQKEEEGEGDATHATTKQPTTCVCGDWPAYLLPTALAPKAKKEELVVGRRKKRGAATATIKPTTTFRKTKMSRPLHLLVLAAALLAAARVDARPGPDPQYNNDERRGYNGVDSRYFSTQQRPPPINDLPIFNPYTPEKAPQVPIKIGERSKLLFRNP